MTDSIETAEEAREAGIRAAWIGLAGMMATAGLQLAIVAISGSISLFADTIHNLGHAVTTIPLLIAFRLGRRPPTRRYPYGFRRAEDVAGVLIAVVVAASAVWIIVEAVTALIEPRQLTNLGWVFAAGLIGAAGNELVAIYRIRVGRRIGSAALIAEGNHARADGLTSLVVVAAVIGVWLGFPRADAAAGLLVAVAVVWILVNSCRTIFRRLMDGVDDGTVERIESVAGGVDGVRDVGRVRARWAGHRLEGDITITVDAAATVADGHLIARRVNEELRHGVRHLDHVVVHVHPN
ncbi:cation diffusion facilitator family transporter [Phytoactinopolyspora halotolerans]|uniref:cation diffusion facilitator family transporter n=1 Tax=Phytoactinopolyspora halotolerans TaxID=1981512 RepID=UPI001C20B681|nr:cation diffusion facilitator family transporter [Phytoactinopolyspora halotolerans]